MRGSIPRCFCRTKSASRTHPACSLQRWAAVPPSRCRLAATISARMGPREDAANTAEAGASNIDVFTVDAENGPRREYHLATHFQPIFSLAHRRPVGYEALIRGTDASGRIYLPAELLAQAPAGVARMQLDRQCRALHVRSFRRLRDDVSWLFLNVDPHIAVRGHRFGSFAQMLEDNALSPHRVAVELIETPFDDEKRLVTAVEHYHELGCLVVIDEIGRAHV